MRSAGRWLSALFIGVVLGWWGAEMVHDRGGDHVAVGVVVGEDDDRDDADGDDDDVPVRQRLVEHDGEVRVRLTAAESALAGIRTTLPATVGAEVHVRLAGRALAVADLLTEQARLRALVVEIDANASVMTLLQQRLRELAGGGRLGAARDIRGLELELARVRAAQASRRADLAARQLALAAAWGRPLAERTRAADGLAQALLDGSAVLVAFSLPPNAHDPPASVRLSSDECSVDAVSLGPAPRAVPGIAGRAWYAVAMTGAGGAKLPPGLAPGSPVDVWIPGAGGRGEMVLVPPAAIVWDGHGRWVFVMTADNEFARRPVEAAVRQPEGIAVSGLDADLPVVVAGVQALLGERFREGIPDEDED